MVDQTSSRLDFIGNVIALTIAVTLATSFVGFLAWAVAKPPLMVIAGICLILMVYGLFQDIKPANGVYRRNDG